MSVITNAYHPEAVQAALLAPVLCEDCQTYVPLGWIDQTGGVFVQCPAETLTRGHRASTAALTSILDAAANTLASA